MVVNDEFSQLCVPLVSLGFGSRYQFCNNYIGYIHSGNFTASEIGQQKFLSHVENNFVRVNFEFKSKSFFKYNDVPSFTVDMMGAQLGGILSLWLGLILMFAFEILELIYTMIASRLQRKAPDVVSDATITTYM